MPEYPGTVSDRSISDSETSKRALTVGANCCEARWNGLRTSHCSNCHQTFTAPSAFDRHRRGGQCLAPDTVGLGDAGRAYPCWGDTASYDFRTTTASE